MSGDFQDLFCDVEEWANPWVLAKILGDLPQKQLDCLGGARADASIQE